MTRGARSPSGRSGVHWDPHQCASYGSVSPYGYDCPCAYSDDPGYQDSYGSGYECAPEDRAGVTLVAKHRAPASKSTPAATGAGEPAVQTTVAQPALLPFTGDDSGLIAALGVGLVGVGLLAKRRVTQ